MSAKNSEHKLNSGCFMGIEDTVKDRGESYGSAEEQWALSQRLKGVVRDYLSIKKPSLDPVILEMVEMIMLKVSRLLAGRLDEDTVRDIEGYARVARETLFLVDPEDRSWCGSAITGVQGAATGGLDAAMARVDAWADGIIPDRTAEGALRKLVMEELPELLNGDLDDPSEWADVAILVLDGMKLRGIDPVKAINDKMAINENREWEINRYGVVQHVED